MATRLAFSATVLVFLLAPAALDAVTIFATFEGTVTAVDGPISFIMPGDAISGSFQYESDAVNGAPGPDVGSYTANNVLIQVESYSPELHNAAGCLRRSSGRRRLRVAVGDGHPSVHRSRLLGCPRQRLVGPLVH